MATVKICKDEGLRHLSAAVAAIIIVGVLLGLLGYTAYAKGKEKGEQAAEAKFYEGFQEAARQCQEGYNIHMKQFHPASEGGTPISTPSEFVQYKYYYPTPWEAQAK